MKTFLWAVAAIVPAGLVAMAEPAVDWPPLPPLPVGPFVVLADGGIVAGAVTAITPVHVAVESPILGRIDLSRDAVRGYRASTAVGPPATTAGAPPATILFMNGDAAAATSLEVRDDSLRFAPADLPLPSPGAVSVPFDRIRAIDFAVRRAPHADRRQLVALADGSRFAAASLPKECDPADIMASVVDGDGTRLLESLEPIAYDPPATGIAWPLVRGATLTGGWPAARGVTAFSGIGIHAPARVRYRLDRPATGFSARVAIDDSAGQGGSVVVRVRARSRDAAFREVAASPVLRGGDEPLSIAADLDGATEVELAVEPADVGTVLDRTIWLDPRITW